MTSWAPPIQKVTALITRPGPDGPEVIVFDHGDAGVQLPAGTVEDGEPFPAAAFREAWEETGALGLELVREVGRLDRTFVGRGGALAHAVTVDGRTYDRGHHLQVRDVDGQEVDARLWDGTPLSLAANLVARGEERHIFHLRAAVAMPDEWAVVSPDGLGSTWTCFWAGIDDAYKLTTEWGRDWLDAARPAVDRSAADDPPLRPRPPYPPELRADGEWEEFWAYPEVNRRFVLSLDDVVDPERCVRARGLCVTTEGGIVLVGGDELPWGIPGGGREGDEDIRQTLAREVWEEACSHVVDSRFLTALRGVPLDARGGVGGPVEHHALFWARVEIDHFVPEFETRERRVVRPREAIDIVQFPDTTRLLLDRAVEFDPVLEWEPEVE